jgi:uncharacterized protein (TIGR01777 family)
MATILITGGTGMIGTVLTKVLLEKGHHVIILARKRPDHSPDSRVSYALWDVKAQTMNPEAISKADHIVHLAGANVGEKRWTKKRKKEIVNSRVRSGELLVRSMQEVPNQIKSVISASAIGWYGPDPVIPNPSPFKEDDPVYTNFLARTCKQWEESLAPVTSMGKRLVKLRTGIVISKEGGVVKEFLKPLRFGMASILGNGKQVMTWIHIDDLVELYIKAIENEEMSGVYNAVAPQPVSNETFVIALARSRQKSYTPFHVPAFVLRIVLGEMSIEVLKSATVSSNKIEATGFVFKYPTFESVTGYLGAASH